MFWFWFKNLCSFIQIIIFILRKFWIWKLNHFQKLRFCLLSWQNLSLKTGRVISLITRRMDRYVLFDHGNICYLNLFFEIRSVKFITAKEHVSSEMDTPTRVSWSMVFSMAKVSLNGPMVPYTRGNSKAMRLLVLVDINGQMVQPTKDKWEMVSDMELENTSTHKKVLNIKVNGLMEWDMELVLSPTKMAQYTKDSGREAWNGEMERWLMLVTTIMKVNGPTINETVKEPCTGSQAMKNMKEIGKTISKVALVLIFGLMEQLTTNFSETDMSVTGN